VHAARIVHSVTFAADMTRVYTTEVTSGTLASDNPIHQRLLQAYFLALPYVKGKVLEVGCGEGRGFNALLTRATHLTAVDRMRSALDELRKSYPQVDLRAMQFPPLASLADNCFDTVVSLQVIEHIRDDDSFFSEINRVLKPGGMAVLTTPNRPMSLSRNPWHVREYTAVELQSLAGRYFASAEVKGISGSERVMQYHEKNRESVRRMMWWDVLDLQHRLPAYLLRTPYEILNRINRNRLYRQPDELATSIQRSDYLLTDSTDTCLDLFLVATKG
jgi:2-polyprenyl-3-methyl-5-hydroxy-6-metoxy-1,4-benzoquinol methylase